MDNHGWAVPSETGLGVSGTGLEIGFGRHIDGAVSAVNRLSGQTGATSSATLCKDAIWRTVSWPNGLTLIFEDDQLAGWTASEDSPIWSDGAPIGLQSAGRWCPTVGFTI